MLKAVNLGSDTVTTRAVTGGLAGYYYGFESIPKDWVAILPNKEVIDTICHKFELHYLPID